jgi:hypothetical protein
VFSLKNSPYEEAAMEKSWLLEIKAMFLCPVTGFVAHPEKIIIIKKR